MQLLVIEDNDRIASLLQRGFTEQGHAVSVCASGIEGERMAATGAWDVIVLDVGLPDRSGINVCRNLRQSGVTTPILMLTVLASTGDKVRGLDAGADDYLTKPFEFEELTARLHALQRRGRVGDAATLKYDDLEIDLSRRTVTRGGQRLTLTRREFDLLTLFMRNPQRVLSRDSIGTAVWDHNFDPRSNVVDVYVCTLRRKINEQAKKPLIRTIIGCGYALDDAPGGAERDQP
jgi:DNA-binding response OmpR family regulator